MQALHTLLRLLVGGCVCLQGPRLRTYLKPAALGTLGQVSSLRVISMPGVFFFFSQTLHQVTRYTNQPLPLRRDPCPRIAAGPLYLTDGQEKLQPSRQHFSACHRQQITPSVGWFPHQTPALPQEDIVQTNFFTFGIVTNTDIKSFCYWYEGYKCEKDSQWDMLWINFSKHLYLAPDGSQKHLLGVIYSQRKSSRSVRISRVSLTLEVRERFVEMLRTESGYQTSFPSSRDLTIWYKKKKNINTNQAGQEDHLWEKQPRNPCELWRICKDPQHRWKKLWTAQILARNQAFME